LHSADEVCRHDLQPIYSKTTWPILWKFQIVLRDIGIVLRVVWTTFDWYQALYPICHGWIAHLGRISSQSEVHLRIIALYFIFFAGEDGPYRYTDICAMWHFKACLWNKMVDYRPTCIKGGPLPSFQIVHNYKKF